MVTYSDSSKWSAKSLLVISGLIVLGFGAIAFTSLRTAHNEQPPPPTNDSKVVIYWNKFFSRPNFGWGLGRFAEHCPVYKNCYITQDRKLRETEDFDAILFHGINGEFNVSDLPAKRKSGQKYVFVSLESPANRRAPREKKFSQFFNTRITYHWDSEVIWTYYDIREKRTNRTMMPSNNSWIEANDMRKTQEGSNQELDKILRGKNKLAIWYVSNCHAQSGRDQYVKEMQKYVDVSVFGGCSANKGCPRSRDCFREEVEPQYFFYMSFENSLCEDYVTEKFFNPLKYYVVPVVYGGANYTKFAPPKSHINALDFESPKELSNYLKSLSENLTEYRTYFDWKNHYEVVPPKSRLVCDLCRVLNEESSTPNFMEVPKWYTKENKCPLQMKLDSLKASGKSEPYATKKTLVA